MSMSSLENLHPDSALRRTTLEIEEHVGKAGWDQAPRLFALVSTAALLEREPHLRDRLGDSAEDDSGFTAIEQEEFGSTDEFEELLLGLAWPEEVEGCVAVIERVMLPPEAESSLPEDSAELLEFVEQHPERRDVRLTAAVTRDGQTHSTVRARVPADADLLEGPDLVPTLVELLSGTLT